MNYSLKKIYLKGQESVEEFDNYSILDTVFRSYLDKDIMDIKNVSVIDNKTGNAISVLTLSYGTTVIYSVGDIVSLKRNKDAQFVIKRFDCYENCAYIEKILDNGLAGGKELCFGLESLEVVKRSKKK